jgi:Fur family peroxide stress response transcriptional regulator
MIYDYSLRDVKDRIVAHGMKGTTQRIAIYKVMISSDHPSVEEVYTKIEKEYPGISLSTVYNTLEKFAETKLIGKVKTGNGKMRYDGRIEPHAHMYYTKTGKLVDYFDDQLQKMIRNHFSKKHIPDFSIDEIQILINGDAINN